MSSTSNRVDEYLLREINSYCLPITDPTHKKHPLALIMKQKWGSQLGKLVQHEFDRVASNLYDVRGERHARAGEFEGDNYQFISHWILMCIDNNQWEINCARRQGQQPFNLDMEEMLSPRNQFCLWFNRIPDHEVVSWLD